MGVTNDPSWQFLNKPYNFPLEKVIEMSMEAVNSVQASLYDSFNNTVIRNPEYDPAKIAEIEDRLGSIYHALADVRRQLTDLEQTGKTSKVE